MNDIDIDSYRSLVELLKKALEFYADKNTYSGFMGNASSIDLDDQGSQARFALDKIREVEESHEKLLADWDEIKIKHADFFNNVDQFKKIFGDENNENQF